jgi:transketolase
MADPPSTLRDACIDAIYAAMERRASVMFLSADFGAPRLDQLRKEFPRRFFNVGIAEQNMVNVAAGLALEGHTVFAYAIAPFLCLRAYEQIRNNLSMLSRLRPLNVNLIGVGTGLSYDVSGPTHHCLEDLGVMRALPGVEVTSPCGPDRVRQFVRHALTRPTPKYLRLDGKPLPPLPDRPGGSFEHGHREVIRGQDVALVATGYMTHKAVRVAGRLRAEGISAGVVDVFHFTSAASSRMARTLQRYDRLATMEEGFMGRGGLDAHVAEAVPRFSPGRLWTIGFRPGYVFDIGGREFLYERCGLGDEDLLRGIRRFVGRTGQRSRSFKSATQMPGTGG